MQLARNFFGCSETITIEDLCFPDVSKEAELESRVSMQNNIFTCLELLANAGSTTHRVEHVGSMLCLRLGFKGFFSSLFFSHFFCFFVSLEENGRNALFCLLF